jgi:hypothetical protein
MPVFDMKRPTVQEDDTNMSPKWRESVKRWDLEVVAGGENYYGCPAAHKANPRGGDSMPDDPLRRASNADSIIVCLRPMLPLCPWFL